MEAMPGNYAPPAGELLLARHSNGTPVGCVGLRPIQPHGCCEMKRLYVSPEGRGFGLGARLVGAVVKEAERIGYREMRLDTLPSMAGAIALYRKLGFEPMEPYYDTPVIGTILLETTSTLLQSWLGSSIGGLQLTVYSLILMAVILWRPTGLMGLINEAWQRCVQRQPARA